jgi:hypothetical protein
LEAAVTGKADAALSRLFNSANTLNTISDEITTQIKELEAALTAHGIGVSAWVTVDTWSADQDNYSLSYSASIGFDKHNGKWGLLYSIWCNEFDEAQVSFLRETSREIRIGALEKLPELFEKLADETQNLIKKATKNLSDAKDIAAALKKNGRATGSSKRHTLALEPIPTLEAKK